MLYYFCIIIVKPKSTKIQLSHLQSRIFPQRKPYQRGNSKRTLNSSSLLARNSANSSASKQSKPNSLPPSPAHIHIYQQRLSSYSPPLKQTDSPALSANSLRVVNSPHLYSADPASARPIPESGQLEVRLGDEAEMSCISEGVPKPVLAWSFQGEELPILASGQKLRIHATNRSLAGVYTCTASNGIGEPAKANIELRVKRE